MAKMMSDAQLFVLPNGNQIVVHKDGRVVYTHQDSTESYPTESDISETSLGCLLRSGLLETSLETGSLETNSLRATPNDLNVKVNVMSKGKGNVKGSRKTLLTEETGQKLLQANIPVDVLRFFGCLSGYANALNNSKNPAKAAETMRAKPDFSARLAAWLKKNPVPQPPSPDVESKVFQICDVCGEDENACTCQPSSAYEIED